MRNKDSKSGPTVFRLLIILVGIFVLTSVTSCDNGPSLNMFGRLGVTFEIPSTWTSLRENQNVLAQLRAQGLGYTSVYTAQIDNSCDVMLGYESNENVPKGKALLEARRLQLKQALQSGLASKIHRIALTEINGYETLVSDVEKPNGARALDYRLRVGNGIVSFIFIANDGDIPSRIDSFESVVNTVKQN